MTDTDNEEGTHPEVVKEGSSSAPREFDAAEISLGGRPEPQPEGKERVSASNGPAQRRRRGHRLLIFLLGLIMGAAGAVAGLPYANRLLETMRSPLAPATPSAGMVVEKRLEDERLLLRVSTDEGVMLAIFTQNLEDIDLLIGRGDSVEFGVGRYEPFLHDPAILRVRPAEPDADGRTLLVPGESSPDGSSVERRGEGLEPLAEREARVTYERRMEEQLEQLEALIAEFDRQVTSAGTEISEAARRQLEELKERGATARAKLEEMRVASTYAWEDLRAGIDEAWEDLRVALIEARSRFGEDDPANPSDG